jgi:N-methylhydantoinase A
MRYAGQEYTINVLLPASIDLAVTVEDFHAAHQRRYGHSNPAAAVEFVNLRLATFGAVSKYDGTQLDANTDQAAAVMSERSAVFDGLVHKTPILFRDDLAAGFEINGPAIIEEQSATSVVPPGWRMEVDAQGNILLRRR